MPVHFELIKSDPNCAARAGYISTDHGTIETPIFMPVGTQGAVKAVKHAELLNLGAQIILGNTFHLYLRPGHELIKRAGGLHAFINWPKPMLTDSGGYQVYSLNSIRKITEEGVRFQSPVDGSYHFFSPESAIQIQQAIGADIIMAFDECTPYPCEYSYAKKSMELTHRWLDRCFVAFDKKGCHDAYSQTLAPIVQGSTYENLRRISAQYIASKDAEVYAIGGLSVGEPAQEMYEMTELVCEILPKEKARYLMGVGTPENILECIERGIDMFDCVLPTRNARHGLLYTSQGVINIRNKKWTEDFSPVEPMLEDSPAAGHSKAYLRHLFKVQESYGLQIASIHNLYFYLWLVREARCKIIDGNFSSWKSKMLSVLMHRL